MVPSITEPSTVSSGGSTAARLLRLFVIAFTVARGAYAADECAAAKRNCEADAGCLACRTVETTPVACATTATTCDGWWAMACCLYGSSSICLQSELLLGYLQCLAQGNDCIIDGVCPGDDDGGTDRGAADAADNDDDPTASTDSDDDPDSEPGAGAIGGGGDDAQGEGNDLDLELTRSPARATFACSAALSLALPLAVSGASALL